MGPALRFDEIFFKSKIPKREKYKITIFLEGVSENKDLKTLNKFLKIARKIPQILFQVKKNILG